MPVSLTVQIAGLDRYVAWLGIAPAELVQGAQRATETVTRTEAEVIRANTPRVTGTLASSIQMRMDRTSEGATGRIFSDVRYAPFVDRGTLKHGAAQHMFEKGYQAAQQTSVVAYGETVQAVLDTA